MKKLWSVFILILITHLLSAQDEGNINLVKEHISKYGQAEIIFKYPGKEALELIPGGISLTKVIENNAWAKVSAFDLADMANFPFPYKVIDRTGQKAVESAISTEEAMNWEKYPTYQQYDSIMHKLVEDYPALCSLESIGESVEGRQVYVLKISDNVSLDEDEPEVFYTSTMHGDELVGYVLMLRLAEHLLLNASNGGLEQQLVDSLEIWINPNANPDGTYAGGDTIDYSTRENANGVDMNRNFPDIETGASPPVEIVPPAGAPEISDMVQFLEDHHFVLSANFHSGIELVNYPWDKWTAPDYHPDHDWFEKVSRAYADTVHYYTSTPGYFDDLDNGVTHGATWYAVRGGRQDYVTYERQGREVTIELHYQDATPAAMLATLWNDNYRSMLNYLANAFYGIHGTVVDDDTDLPVEAKIFIQGHDADSSHIYSNSVNSSFVRLIDQGSWSMAVSAEGYETLFLSNIQTIDNQQTILNIRLLDGTGIEDTAADQLKIWPVPADDIINIQLPVGTAGKEMVSIFNINGSLVSRKIYYPSPESLIRINVSLLPAGIYFMEAKNPDTQKTYHAKFVVN